MRSRCARATACPCVPRGAGTGYAAGAVARHGGVILNLCRMRRIVELDQERGRLRAEAGVTASIQRRAADAGLHYPPDPGAASTSTIGGNVACNAAGPHSFRYGTTADYLVGATLVLGDGRVLRLGEGSDASPLLPLLGGLGRYPGGDHRGDAPPPPAPGAPRHPGRAVRRPGARLRGGRRDRREGDRPRRPGVPRRQRRRRRWPGPGPSRRLPGWRWSWWNWRGRKRR